MTPARSAIPCSSSRPWPCGALASASAAAGPGAQRRLEESAAVLERLSPSQQATRLPAFWMHGRARRALGQCDAALAELRRGAALAEQTGASASC